MRIDIELLRIISAFGIVYFHSGNLSGKEFAYAGLVFFVIISAYFAICSPRSKKPLARLKRLMIPCIIWSIVYGLFNLILKGKIFPMDCSLAECLLSTPALHFWYLPYMCCILIAIDRLKNMFAKEAIGKFSGIMACLLFLSAPIWRTIEYSEPWGQYMHALPGVFIGLFLGCYFQLAVKERRLILGSIIMAILLMIYWKISGIGIPYLFGLLPSLLLLKSDLFSQNTIEHLPSISLSMFGVYLVHGLFIIVLSYFGFNSYILPILAFSASLIFVLMLNKNLPQNIRKYLI